MASTAAPSAGSTGGVGTQPTRRRLLLRLFVVVPLSIVAALGVAEVAVRVALPVTDFPVYFWDPVVGPRRAPNQTGRYIKGNYVNAPYHFNAQGWNHPNDYETIKPPGTRRVCVVGDSFVEALQVPHEQTFFALAQKRMSRPDRPVQWYAFGNSGYGTSSEYLLIRHYMLDYHPDVVVIHFGENDIADCSPYLVPQPAHEARYRLDDNDQLVLLPAQFWQPSSRQRFFMHSALVRYLRLQHQAFVNRRPHAEFVRDLFAHPEKLIAAAPYTAGLSAEQREQKTWTLIERLLAAAQRDCAERGALLVVAYRGCMPEMQAAFQKKPYQPPLQDVDPYCLAERLDEMGREIIAPMCARLNIPYLDLTPAIVAKVRATGQRHDFPDDQHYGPIGHEAAAEALSDWIDQLWATGASATGAQP